VEKRFVLFLVLSMAIIFGHLAVRQMFAPPRPVVEQEVEQADADRAAGDEKDEDQKPPPSEKPETDSPPDLAEKAPPPAEKPEAQLEVARQFVSIGSYAANSPYALLVTFDNRGAAILRIELTERDADGNIRYRSLEDRSGYLGHLALKPVRGGGCRVNVVGHGTPADTATPTNTDWGPGIRAGDILKIANERPLQVTSDLDEVLQETVAGDEIELTVERDFDGEKRTTTFTAVLGERPLEIIRPEPLMDDEIGEHPLSMLLSLHQVGDKEVVQGVTELAGIPSLRDNTWEVTKSDDPHPLIEFRFALDRSQMSDAGVGGSLEIVKRFRFREDPDVAEKKPGVPLYHLEYEAEVFNRGEEEIQVALRFDGPNGLPLEGWWYSNKIHPRMFKGAGARDVLVHAQTQRLISCPDIFDFAEENPKTPDKVFYERSEDPPLDYVAVDTQYFLAALLPRNLGGDASHQFDRGAAMALGDLAGRKGKLIRKTNVSFQLTSPVWQIAPGDSVRRNLVLFAGPKETELLRAYGLEEAIYYGWFSAVARPLSGLLHFFYGIVGNYGLAIIMLTVLVRGCMFPLGRKAAKNAAMMQELAPEMRAIAEKYKNDMEKRAKAQQDLFRKHNYNPLGGCWLMFLQLPIFIGLYRSLAVDIHLRDAALIPGIRWCSNLAGPDKLMYWESFLPTFLVSETGMLGPYLNVLPLITIALFLLQQKLFTPPATDEQTRMQMQMMKFMMIFMGFLFFKVASGLCLYFIASALWSVAERKLVPKPQPGTAATSDPASPKKTVGIIKKKAAASEPKPARRPATRKRPKRR
jgi:YidC/Oxa1 family membrane protein insertase